MMILTDPRLLTQFTDFGILIPIRPSKITRVLEHLESLPALAQVDWCVRQIEGRVTRELLARVHSQEYLDRLYGDQLTRAILEAYELIDSEGNAHRYAPETAKKPLSSFFEDVVLIHVAGTLQACRMALRSGWSFFTGGGMHHAHADRGTGFCLVNDMVAAARQLQAEGAVRNVWIIDIDAHKGDGTASVCAADPSILTLSLHMRDGWPLDRETALERGSDNPSLVPSDVEIALGSGEDDQYLEKLSAGLDELNRLAETTWGRPADLALVVDGADPYEGDELPSTSTMRLTLEQMLERDLLVDRFLTERRIPSAWLNAGGYGDAVWKVYAQFLERVLPSKLREARAFPEA